MSHDSIAGRLLDQFDVHSNAPFLVHEERSITYGEAALQIHSVAALIEDCSGDSPLVGVMAERGHHAYIGIFASLMAGRGWVPMTPRQPVARLRQIAASAELRVIVIDAASVNLFLEVFFEWPTPVIGLVVSAEPEVPVHDDPRLVDATTLVGARAQCCLPRSPDNIAYIMFTSGTTGAPKGVPISNRNVTAYLDFVIEHYGFGLSDRHSQTFDLSFDLSVHDLLVPATTGGAIVPFIGGDLLSAARKVDRCQVTSWFSVPSQIAMMERARALRPDSMPSLRASLFCGEALPVDLALKWSAAAPNSAVDNLYGPTEATIAFTHWRFDASSAADLARRGVVPIGKPFDGLHAIVVDLETSNVIDGEGRGELWLGGTQLSSGYWKLPSLTEEKFVSAHHDVGPSRWYRTGDRVDRDANGVLHFVGRLDHQVKLRGYRIELLGVEAVLREIADTPLLVVAPWPMESGRVAGLTAVLFGSESEPSRILKMLKDRMPSYMVPDRCILLPGDPPRNASGKIDRNAILKILGFMDKC